MQTSQGTSGEVETPGESAGGEIPSGEALLHTRRYEVEVYRHSESVLRVRGWLRDIKPDGLWLVEDEEPLTIHHMLADLFVQVPSLQIVDVRVEMRTRPNDECATVEEDYRKLIGLSIVRGFSHKVKELFGGPRSCTHVTMLLQAMAPAAIQSLWAMVPPAEGEAPVLVSGPRHRQRVTDEQRRQHVERNRDTCHVWAANGPMFARIEAGEQIPIPSWGRRRLAELGLTEEDWYGEGA